MHPTSDDQVLNIPDCYQSPLFNQNIDKLTGFKTQSILCCAIPDASGKTVAVLEALNKADGGAFTTADELALKLFGTHLGNALTKGRMHEASRRESRRLARLYHVCRRLAATLDLGTLVDSACQAVRDLVDAEHAFVFLTDTARGELWADNGASAADNGPRHHSAARYATVRARLGQGAVGTAAVSHQPTILKELEPGDPLSDFLAACQHTMSSVLVHPMVVDDVASGKCLGVLVALNKRLPDANSTDILLCGDPGFTPSDSNILALLALDVADMLQHRALDCTVASALSVVSPAGFNLQQQATAAVLRAQLMDYIGNPDGGGPGADGIVSMEDGMLTASAPALGWRAQSFTSGSRARSMSRSWRRSSVDEFLVKGSVGGGGGGGADEPSRAAGAVGNGARDRARDPRRASLPDIAAEGIGRSPFSPPNPSFFTMAQLTSWSLDVTSMAKPELLKLSYDLFIASGLPSQLRVSDSCLRAFIAAVASHYHDNPYHNFSHVCNVLHVVWLIVQTTGARALLTGADQLGLLVAALCHDVGHDGHTNAFHVATSSELAMIYNDQAVLENHHTAMTFAILAKRDCNLFELLPEKTRKQLRKLIVDCILNTDMSRHFALTQEFRAHPPKFDPDSEADRLLLCRTILHAADIANPVLPFAVNKVWSERVHVEFRAQVAEEQRLGIPSAPHMTATDEAVRNRLEVNFIDYVVAPLWQRLAEVLPELAVCTDTLRDNRAEFQRLSGGEPATLSPPMSPTQKPAASQPLPIPQPATPSTASN